MTTWFSRVFWDLFKKISGLKMIYTILLTFHQLMLKILIVTDLKKRSRLLVTGLLVRGLRNWGPTHLTCELSICWGATDLGRHAHWGATVPPLCIMQKDGKLLFGFTLHCFYFPKKFFFFVHSVMKFWILHGKFWFEKIRIGLNHNS